MAPVVLVVKYQRVLPVQMVQIILEMVEEVLQLVVLIQNQAAMEAVV